MPQSLYHPSWEDFDSSKIQCYMDCPRKYFYNYILGWESDRPNNHLIFGQAWHEGMEHIMTHTMTEDAIEPAYNRFLAKYRESFPAETDELFIPKTPNNAFLGYCVYIGKYRNQDRFQTLHVEIGGKVHTGKHSLIYKMDHVGKDENSRIFAFEHKTTSGGFKQVWFDEWLLSLQIGTYSYALKCMFPEVQSPLVIINGASFSKKKVDCERQPVKKSPGQLRTWLFTVNYWIDSIKDEMDLMLKPGMKDASTFTAFPMNPRACTNYFRLCPYHDFCMAWQNPLTRALDGPPEGFIIRYWNPLEELDIKERIDLEGIDL